MSTLAWIANGLKSLRLGSGSTSALQHRLAGTQATPSIPPKPKRPLTPYFRFLGQVRAEVSKENPNLKPTELMKLVGQRWEKLDSARKEKYVTGFRDEMQGYTTVIEKYNKSLSLEDRQTLEQNKLDRELRKEKRDKKKRLKELGKPKKPASPFLQFLHSKVAPGSGIETQRAAAKEMAVLWKTMTDSDKRPWIEKYTKDLELYSRGLIKWEELMVKQGNDDVVRVNQKRRMVPPGTVPKTS